MILFKVVPLIVVMIPNEMGSKLKTLLDIHNINISIVPKNCQNKVFYLETKFNYQKVSYFSVFFIIIGNMCLLILLVVSFSIIYLVQKTKLAEERERTNVIFIYLKIIYNRLNFLEIN